MIKYCLRIHHGGNVGMFQFLNRPLDGIYLSRIAPPSLFGRFSKNGLTRKARHFIKLDLYSKVREKEFEKLLKTKVKEKI